MSEIVGEGSYGCVAKPSLKCTTVHDYTNKVSKIMTTRDAKSEQKKWNCSKKKRVLKNIQWLIPNCVYPKETNFFIK